MTQKKSSSNFKPSENIHTATSYITTNPREPTMLRHLRRTLTDVVAYCAFQNVRNGRKMRKDAGNKNRLAIGSSYNGKLAHYFKYSCHFVQPV